MDAREVVVTLDSLPSGASGRVVKVEGGRGLVARLYQMGFAPGTLVKVIVNSWAGPLVVEVMGIEIALGRGIAKKVFVEVTK